MPDHIQSRSDDMHPGKAKRHFTLGNALIFLVIAGTIAAIVLLT